MRFWGGILPEKVQSAVLVQALIMESGCWPKSMRMRTTRASVGRASKAAIHGQLRDLFKSSWHRWTRRSSIDSLATLWFECLKDSRNKRPKTGYGDLPVAIESQKRLREPALLESHWYKRHWEEGIGNWHPGRNRWSRLARRGQQRWRRLDRRQTRSRRASAN